MNVTSIAKEKEDESENETSARNKITNEVIGIDLQVSNSTECDETTGIDHRVVNIKISCSRLLFSHLFGTEDGHVGLNCPHTHRPGREEIFIFLSSRKVSMFLLRDDQYGQDECHTQFIEEARPIDIGAILRRWTPVLMKMRIGKEGHEDIANGVHRKT